MKTPLIVFLAGCVAACLFIWNDALNRRDQAAEWRELVRPVEAEVEASNRLWDAAYREMQERQLLTDAETRRIDAEIAAALHADQPTHTE